MGEKGRRLEENLHKSGGEAVSETLYFTRGPAGCQLVKLFACLFVRLFAFITLTKYLV